MLMMHHKYKDPTYRTISSTNNYVSKCFLLSKIWDCEVHSVQILFVYLCAITVFQKDLIWTRWIRDAEQLCTFIDRNSTNIAVRMRYCKYLWWYSYYHEKILQLDITMKHQLFMTFSCFSPIFVSFPVDMLF